MKKRMKLAAICALALAAAPTLPANAALKPEVRAIVGECAQNPQKLKQTISTLPAEEQLEFLGAVNEAISKMPGSNEVKGAAFYEANRAAVTGAGKDNLKAVLAEVFATVPTEYLTEINERFAKELFSRTANPAHVPTDAEFVQLSTNTMAVVNARCQNAEDASVRETFAILMLVRASGGTPADLAQTLVSQLPDAQVRETALNEWIKAAMGDGQEQSYDPMLAASQAADEEPDHAAVTSLVGGRATSDALLADLAASTDVKSTAATIGAGAFREPGVPGAAVHQSDLGLYRIPRAFVSSTTAVGGTSAGPNSGENPYYTRSRDPHPTPYRGQ
ncbi:MAG: hypothetical protein IJ658_09975 [Kiritimatiellae bacterium]|nr:hypothetical protein [Kiritimatiellia bacterium]